MGEVRVVLKEGLDEKSLEGAVAVTGFQGFGFTGYIATRYLRDKLDAKLVGFILTEGMPDIVIVENGVINPPHGIYLHDDGQVRMIIIVNHMVPNRDDLVRYSEQLVKWLKRVGVRELVLIGGLDRASKADDPEELRCILVSGYKPRCDLPLINKDIYVVGPLALLACFSEAYGLPSVIILPYAEVSRPDPRAAAIALETVGRLYSISISVEELYEDERRIREELERISKYHKGLEERRSMHYM